MAILSGFTIIRALSLFHLTAAYFFLTAPKVITDQNVVYVLGEAIRVVHHSLLYGSHCHLTDMSQPHVTTVDKPNEASAFIAVLLIFIGIADLTAASLDEEISLHYWLSNVPVRLLFLFGLTGYVYLFKDDGLFGSGPSYKVGPGGLLRNSLFSWAFMETMVWFWVSGRCSRWSFAVVDVSQIFTSLREERREQARKRVERLQAQEDRL